MKKFTCNLCGEVLSTYRGRFKKHIEEIHNLNFEDYLREYHKELGGYCSVCGKPTGLINLNKGFHQFCSKKCCSIGTVEQRKQTWLEKYGVEHPFQSPEIRNRIKQTMLEKYGVEHPLQNKDIQNKHKQTMLEKYGVENPALSPEIQEKMKNTCLEKYGVEHVLQSPEIKEKMKQTMIEKYGVEYALQNDIFKEKSKQTCKEHYGVEHNMYSNIVKNKVKDSSIPYRFSLHEEVCKRLDIVILESPEEWYHKEWDLDIHTHRFHCNIHNLDFESEWFADRNLCPKCLTAHYSRGEREVGDYIESLGFQIIRNDRIQIGLKEIDIWIPSKNIGIEYNGEYWHQDQSRDQEKKFLCESKGIRLYTVWDTQWENDKEEVKEYLRRLLNQ